MHGEEITRIESVTFSTYDRFTKCLQSHAYHITMGQVGKHVKRLQVALPYLLRRAYMVGYGFNEELAESELRDVIERYPKAFIMNDIYGRDCYGAVRAYKIAYGIRSKDQRESDGIVGIMTMKAMEKDIRYVEANLGRIV